MTAIEFIARNHWKDERLAAGFATPADLARAAGIDPAQYEHMEAGELLPHKDELDRLLKALGGIPGDRIYLVDMLQIIGAVKYGNDSIDSATKIMANNKAAMQLFIARDELTWFEKREIPDHPVDVFFSMSCGTQASPHLLLDTVAVAEALGINFAAAAGPAGCCGKPYLGFGQIAAGEGFARSKIEYTNAIGAKTMVVWCTACQQTAHATTNRRALVDGQASTVRETQILTYLEERLSELGDRVPWKKDVRRRVLVEGHDEYSPVHSAAFRAGAKLLSHVPGVEVVGLYDGGADDLSPCAWRSRPAWRGPWRDDTNPEEVQARRVALADMAAQRGADTIACQHQGCHQMWGRYASDRFAVRHAVSIVAEALDCAHPDRAQVASRLGSPEEVIEQTRSIWKTWDLTERQALELAKLPSTAEARYAEAGSHCSCGGGGSCSEQLITLDVPRGIAPGLPRLS